MERSTEAITICQSELRDICSQAFSGNGEITSFSLLHNGAVNTTYKFIRNDTAYVLRFYVRDPFLCEIESYVIQLVDSCVSIPKLIYWDEHYKPYPFAIFHFVEGKHLHEGLNNSLAPSISFKIGKTLSSIHSISFDKAGIFASGLSLNPAFEEGSSPYYQYINEHLTEDATVWKRMGTQLAENVLRFIDEYQNYFPVIGKGGVLVHSDFKPVNLLWNKNKQITVLDWEFAHSGDGLMDFGILLRHYQEFPLDIDQLKKGYEGGGGVLRGDWIQQARITDIVNIVQLLDSPADRPKLYQELLESVNTTINHWDNLKKLIK